jgi:uncharacterized protein YegL
MASPRGAIAEPEPERELTPEERYNAQVNFVGAKVEAIPLYDAVAPGFVNKVPVLFQFVTGTDPSAQREPFSLAVVLDVSGSMQGNKLDNCKTAVAQLIEATSDDDILSLVTYDDSVSVVFESIRCGDGNARKDMLEKLSAVRTHGTTNLYGGLLAGYELLQRQRNAVNKHIFLLSDGEVNAGPVQSTDAILKAVSEWEEKVPILSYGIGAGFNERLMSPLGQVHRGSHYFYITDAASIERLVGKGVRALTCSVARNVHLKVRAMSRGIWFPDSMVEGNWFPLVRERSVIQFLVEMEVRPELPEPACAVERGGMFESWRPCARRRPRASGEAASGTVPPGPGGLAFAWKVDGFPQLFETSGVVSLALSCDPRRKNEEVRTFLDIRRGCELRKTATSAGDARKSCEEALRLFQGCLGSDRFGFAQEWATKTRALLADSSLWTGGGAASAAGAKQLGVVLVRHGVVEEEDEEEEMDFDLFG